mmetsp:Transcript_30065/g.49689  ORF Transcript_30065/g.49689 Transcript_30065/m.49689 type:complete len:247 (+) Transcript_30065:313-1053(+)
MGLVVVQNRNGLTVVTIQTLHQGGRSVIPALHQVVTSDIILHGCDNGGASSILLHGLWWSILDVVRATTLFVNPATADAFLQNFVRDLQLNNLGDNSSFLRKHDIQSLGLLECSGESIQNESKLTIWFLNAILNDPNNNIVRHETSSLHDCLCLLSNLTLSGYSRTQHITSTQLRHAQHVFNFRTVRALAGTGWAKKNQNVAWPVFAKFGFNLLDGCCGNGTVVLSFLVLLLRRHCHDGQTSRGSE